LIAAPVVGLHETVHREGEALSDEPGYVPPDHTTTVEFARPAPPSAAGSESGQDEVAAADPAVETAGEPEPAIVDAVAMAADTPDPVEEAPAPDPVEEAPAPDPGDRRIAGPPPADPPPPVMTNPVLAGFGPKPPREKGAARPQRFAVLFALAAAVLVMVVALGAVSLLSGGGSDGNDDTAPRTHSSRAPSGTPAGGKASGRPTPGARPAPPVGSVVTGNGITYRVVQQDAGYYEARFVITNRTGRPMETWRLSFDARGADVRNVWDARLVRAGSHPVIQNADGADPIPPGGTMDVQYGASGTPAMPGTCLLNGAACGL
jgi:Cellulose binding domain